MKTHYLTKHRNFSNAKQVDAATDFHILQNKGVLTVSDLQVLDVIRRHSEEHGAAQLKHAEIVKETGRSNVTVRRAIRKLVKQGIIQKQHYIHHNMRGLGANIYAIMPYSVVAEN